MNFSGLENKKSFEGEKMEEFWDVFATSLLEMRSEEWRKEEDKGKKKKTKKNIDED